MTTEGLVELAQFRRTVRASHLQLRIARNAVCSQSEAARSAEVPRMYIHRIETGCTYGIGADAMARLMAMYRKFLEACSAQPEQE